MKIQVFMKIQSKVSSTESKIDLLVGPNDSVMDVQQRILDVQPTAFPDQKILFDGHPLSGDAKLSSCGIRDGGELQFIVTPTESAFCQQLGEFLQPRKVAMQELSFLYCHKYGVTVAQALEDLDFKGNFQDFLQEQKGFTLQDGLISAAPQTKAQPQCSQETISTIPLTVSLRIGTQHGTEERSVELAVDKTTTVLELKDTISATELLPFPDREILLEGDILNDEQTLQDCHVTAASVLIMSVVASFDGVTSQLVDILMRLPKCVSSSNELSTMYCCRYGSSLLQALRLAGWKKNIRQFLESSQQFCVAADGCVSLPGQPGILRAIPESAAETVDSIMNAVLSASFLNVDHVTKSTGESPSELVLYLKGLPPKGYNSWKSGLLKATAASLAEINFEDVKVKDDHVQVMLQDGTSVVLRLESIATSRSW